MYVNVLYISYNDIIMVLEFYLFEMFFIFYMRLKGLIRFNKVNFIDVFIVCKV